MDKTDMVSKHKMNLIWLVIALIVLVVAIVLILNKSTGGLWNGQNSDGGVPELTDAERENILKQLESAPVSELTDAEREDILQQLESAPVPDITDAERENILKQLSQ